MRLVFSIWIFATHEVVPFIARLQIVGLSVEREAAICDTESHEVSTTKSAL